MFHRINSCPSSFETAAIISDTTTNATEAPSLDESTTSQPSLLQSQQSHHIVDDTTLSISGHLQRNNTDHENKPFRTTLHFTQPTKSCLSSNRLQDLVNSVEGEVTGNGTTGTSSDPQLHNLLKRKVSFGQIKIREHPRALGDHPAVSSGPALSLGWYSPDPAKCAHSRTTEWSSLEAYEEARGRSPRSRDEIRLPRHERAKILLEQVGVTYSELHTYQQETAQLKHSRNQSLHDRTHFDDDDDECAAGTDANIPPVIKMLQDVGKRLFLFQQKQPPQDHSLEQKQLDDLMARAHAAERVRQQHQVAYWQSQKQQQKQPNQSELQLSSLREQTMTTNTTTSAQTATITTTTTTGGYNPRKIDYSSSEPFFLPLLTAGSDSDDSEQPLDF